MLRNTLRQCVIRLPLIGVALAAFSISGIQGEQATTPERASPPKWSRDVLDAFFPDAREVLQGDRPDYDALARGRQSSDVNVSPATGGIPEAPESGFRWSMLIRPETLEDEIKRLGRAVPQHVATPSGFKGGSYRACRRDFSLLAMLFGVIGDYDTAVRWRDEGAVYRDLFGRAGFNCKVGTDQSFREAQLRVEDLQALVRGSRVDGPEPRPDSVWPQVADRAPLMSRVEIAYEERLSKWLADAGEFRSNLTDIRHEAEVLAALGEVISHEGYEFADDSEYAEYARQLRDGARGIADAVDSEDYNRASDALVDVGMSCADCHEGFRT